VIGVPVRTEVLMGTLVTIHVVPPGADADAAIERAFEWFRDIEARCTRFDGDSELMRLSARIGEPVPASPILFEAVRFALSVAEDTGGAFDPAVGHLMAARGFDREHRTGRTMRSPVAAVEGVSYRDVHVDDEARTITLDRPLTLDLGAVAKGLAIDAAARELQPFGDFAIDAGGDLYLGGRNPDGAPWSVGIRHPRLDGQLIDSLRASNQAVCTSGDYERGAHILDPRAGSVAVAAASVTVVAPTAMLADALATAAFVLGPEEGIRLLERHGVHGLILTPALDRRETAGLRGE
jgi:thiamine biosynthesis lipoprotein